MKIYLSTPMAGQRIADTVVPLTKLELQLSEFSPNFKVYNPIHSVFGDALYELDWRDVFQSTYPDFGPEEIYKSMSEVMDSDVLIVLLSADYDGFSSGVLAEILLADALEIPILAIISGKRLLYSKFIRFVLSRTICIQDNWVVLDEQVQTFLWDMLMAY